MDRTDEQIAAAVQDGDTESFGLLVARYEEKLLRYGRRFLNDRDDIADLVQDAFIKAFENIRGFDTERRFSPWLYRIAHNTFVNELRSRRMNVLRIDLDTLFPQPIARERADDDVLDAETKSALEAHLDDLDPKYREPIVLYYLQELSYEEISEILHIPTATVGVRLHRGRKLLRERYERHT
jgi:RNA polymerase sigma-70 factor (ECF subfamily)